MYSTTGLAVGLAIGIPTVVVVVVLMAFWYRQKINYKNDVRKHDAAEDYDELNDLDLDHIIDSPKDTHQREISDDSVNDFEQPGFTIKHGNYSIKKESKIMGLRMISKEQRDSLSNFNNNSNSDKNVKNGNDSTDASKIRLSSNMIDSNKSSDKLSTNYKVFYESMIPVLPDTVGSSSSFNNTSIDELIPPKTPVKLSKGFESRSGSGVRNSSHSNTDLYKLLQDDSPMYPRNSRLSSNLQQSKEIPQYDSNKNFKKPGKVNNMDIDSDTDTPTFESPSRKNDDNFLSPFDTPPSNKIVSLNDTNNSQNSSLKSPSKDLFPVEAESTSVLDHSPLKNNMHRRINSVESKIIVENDTAEESRNIKRKEWLDTYRKH